MSRRSTMDWGALADTKPHVLDVRTDIGTEPTTVTRVRGQLEYHAKKHHWDIHVRLLDEHRVEVTITPKWPGHAPGVEN